PERATRSGHPRALPRSRAIRAASPLLDDDELHAAVALPTGAHAVVGDRTGEAVTLRDEFVGRHAALVDEPFADRLGAALGQVDVVLLVAAVVGVPLHLDAHDLGPRLDGVGHLPEHLLRVRCDRL